MRTFSKSEEMHGNDISIVPFSKYALQNESERTEQLKENKAVNLPSRIEIYKKPYFSYTIHGTNLNVRLYKTIIVDYVQKMKSTTMTKNFSHLLISTSYFLLQNEKLGNPLLCSVVKDTLIPLISSMDIDDVNSFWESMKKRIHLSVNHCINDGNSPRRRFLPLREPINNDIPKSIDLFVNACLLELQRIQHHRINEQLTLKHVLCEENDYLLYRLMRKELNGTSILVYSRQFSKFLRFKEIIEEQLMRVVDRIFLMQVMEDTCIYTINPDSRIIIELTGDCVKCVVEYLKNDDIRNFIIAFRTNV
ncbi:uncharacterized protein LOC111051477 [Nilaparvata lugens]|uniref:uncharacterized protein LOC111051477 n=1 Tax=Nilaparvata lugens TaxID=108931 RepID=UPI00193D7FAE|nr:uncharacterized protein LOC111051477 [Nilaparvata lugens]